MNLASIAIVIASQLPPAVIESWPCNPPPAVIGVLPGETPSGVSKDPNPNPTGKKPERKKESVK